VKKLSLTSQQVFPQLSIVLALLMGMSVNAMADGGKFTFGIVPQQAASKLAQQWVPIMSYISEETGYQIEFKTSTDIPEFEKNWPQATTTLHI